MNERSWAEIDLAALRHNAAIAQQRAQTGLLAVVKANAYGHGMIPVAQALRDQAEIFGVANVDEAMELRSSGIEQPIMLLGPALPNERGAIRSGGFIPSVSSVDEAVAFGKGVAINFEIDTGMGRIGTWHEEAFAAVEELHARGISLHSVSTHLPVADEDAAFTRQELAAFDAVVRQLRARVPTDFRVHVLLSAGILAFVPPAYDLVRAGLMLYGASPLPDFQHLLRPVMSLKTRIALLRDVPAGRDVSYGRTFTTTRPTRVATLSAGYADGYPRALSNRGAEVLVGGLRCPVLGRITMDMIMVDVTAVPHVQIGDEVVLLGRQGESEILAGEIAQRAGTIAWEIFTGIGSRVRRVYL